MSVTDYAVYKYGAPVRPREVVVILARGNSKGIPRKNLQRVGGETLIGRCVRTCSNWETYVCTEDAEIADETCRNGGTVIDRPLEMCTDSYQGSDVVKYAFTKITGPIDKVSLVQCTAPFTTSGDIRNCLDALTDGVDLAFSATLFHGVIVKSYVSMCVKGYRTVTFDFGESENRQERQPYYQSSGGVYAFRPNYVSQCEWWTGRLQPVLTECQWHCDIDNRKDLEYADMVIRGQQSWRLESVSVRH